MDLIKLCEFAKKAALGAGKIIKEAQGKEVLINKKDGGENLASQVVTEIDLMAEKEILSILSPSLKEFELGLLTEESIDDNSRFEKDYFWCIDPLDGTLAFSKNEKGYSTSIALVSKSGEPIIGVVYNPRTEDLYHAIKGMGAFKNETPLKVSPQGKNVTLLYDQSYLKHPKYDSHIEELKINIKNLGFKKLNISPLGGAVMNAISTIELAPAFYYKMPKLSLGGGSIWDFAASSVIQSEAGAINSDYHLAPLELNRKESTFMNHKGVIFCSEKELLKIIPKDY